VSLIFHSPQNKENPQAGGKPISPFRRSRNGLQPSGRRSRSKSPAHGKQLGTPELLSLCISILTSVVLEDCRYQIALPRPSCPPNALQVLSLDVAQLLLSAHRHEAKTISQIAFAVIPAFSSFQPEMYNRLLKFFEGVIKGLLDDLLQVQGGDDVVFHKVLRQDKLDVEPDVLDPFESHNMPPISIQVDEVPETPRVEAIYPIRMPSSTPLKSTNAPLQPLPLYYLASVIPPLLGAIFESVDLTPSSRTPPEVLHRLSQLLHLVLDAKADAYIDVLQIVGCHSPKVRRAAVNLLTTFWPKAVGHIVVSRPFPVAAHSTLNNVRVPSEWSGDHSHTHQFVPWRFMPLRSNPAAFVGFSHSDCRSCTKRILGFGLLCPFCMCAVHFDCYDYPDGSHLFQYASVSDPNVQRVAMYRFCKKISSGRETGIGSTEKHGHLFRVVNLFTLCLCFICRQPLWGCTTQGLNCAKCMQFVHAACLSNVTVSELLPCSTTQINSDHIMIKWEDLRLSCLKFHREVLHLIDQMLGKLGYEEVSILCAIMWIQVQIITNGVELGSVVVLQNGRNAAHAKDYRIHEFELHHALKMCETHLSSDTLQCSDAMDDYLHENRLVRSEHLLMFDWSNLVYMSSAIKSPHILSNPFHSSSDFLNVIKPDNLNHSRDVALQPFEVVPLWQLRDVLRQEFNIHADVAAHFVLSHLNHIGFFDCLDRSLFEAGSGKDPYCIFPLPFGLDLSTNVEVLLSAVEGCLLDLDLSVNEVGLLLLVRRFWPNGLITELAFRRLTRSVLSWILAEVRLQTIYPTRLIMHDRIVVWQPYYVTIWQSRSNFQGYVRDMIRCPGLQRRFLARPL